MQIRTFTETPTSHWLVIIQQEGAHQCHSNGPGNGSPRSQQRTRVVAGETHAVYFTILFSLRAFANPVLVC